MEVEETDEVGEVKEKRVRPSGHWLVPKMAFWGCGKKGIFVAIRFCEGLCLL